MRRLMLLRHAKTENDAPSGRDQDRRLDDRGRRDAAEIGSWMAGHPPFPDLALVSTAVDWARSQDARIVTLRVAVSNAAARGVYEQLGFGVTQTSTRAGEVTMSLIVG